MEKSGGGWVSGLVTFRHCLLIKLVDACSHRRCKKKKAKKGFDYELKNNTKGLWGHTPNDELFRH
jgi:hypothetical protein